MATSAASPLQQRYNAGSCRLDVTLQPSALSKWYPHPVGEQLAFKLWLQVDKQLRTAQIETAQSDSPENAGLTLIAEGDRTALQAIAQHIQQQTRQTLTVGTLSTPQSTPPQLPPTCLLPPGCLIEGPLSYLQLCDLTSVLNQYEQAAPSLPVALTLADLTETRAASQREPSKNNLIPFPSNRRRRTRLWASSAAAALFAVGLTTTLVANHPQKSSQTAVTADGGIDELEVEAQLEISAALPPQQGLDDTQKTRPSSDATTPQNGAGSAPGQPSASAPNRDSVNRSSSTRQSETPATASTSPPTAAKPRIATGNRPQNAAPSEQAPTRSATSESVMQSGSPLRESNSVASGANTPTENSATSREEIALAPPPIAQSPAPAERPQAAAVTAPEIQTDSNSELLTPADSTAESIDRERIAVAERQAGSGEFEVNPSPSPDPSPSQSDRSDNSEIEDRAMADEDMAAAGSAATARQSPAPSLANAPADNTPEADTIAQVQAYFQSRWQANQNISEPLTYQMQLSDTGDVISFAALNSTAQTYRDRFIPNDRPLSFAINAPAADSADTEQAQRVPAGTALTLRIILTPTGQVRVVKL